MIRRYCFWEPTLSPHKTKFFEAIVRSDPGVVLACFAAQDLLSERRGLGWSRDLHCSDRLEYYIDPNREMIESQFSSAAALRDTLHIFSGLRHVTMITSALRLAVKKHALFGIYSEPRVAEGFSGGIRYLQSVLQEHAIRSSCSLVLAIGAHGPKWFSRVGYSRGTIVPFAYFVDPPVVSGEAPTLQDYSRETSKVIRLGYVGRFAQEKGVDRIIPVLDDLPFACSLSFAGGGELEPILRGQASRCKAPVRFCGVVDNGSIGSFFDEIDILILPSISTNDGWGVVVSEALMSGVAVLVSDRVGSSVVVKEIPILGDVFSPADPHSLSAGINSMVKRDIFDLEDRSRRSRIAIETLSSDAGAKYFSTVVRALESQQLSNLAWTYWGADRLV